MRAKRRISGTLSLSDCLEPGCHLFRGTRQGCRARAARSVHLHYAAPDGTLFYNEATVEQSQRGSYFCAAGSGRAISASRSSATARRSSSSPSGIRGTSRTPTRWRRRSASSCCTRATASAPAGSAAKGPAGRASSITRGRPARPAGSSSRRPSRETRPRSPRTLPRDGTGGWKHLATFRTLSKGSPLKGYYSFVEDFRRDGKSPDRKAARPLRQRLGENHRPATG